jgi:hypothetical protein
MTNEKKGISTIELNFFKNAHALYYLYNNALCSELTIVLKTFFHSF